MDFDEFVCAGWREQHDLRPDQGSMFAGNIMAEKAQTRLRHILESGDNIQEENFYKLKAAYDACLNESLLKERGSKPLEVVLHRLGEIYSRDGGLTDSLLYLIDLGVDALVSAYTSVSQSITLPPLSLC